MVIRVLLADDQSWSRPDSGHCSNAPRTSRRRASGLGAPDDIDALRQRITGLEQQVADLRGQLADQGDELAAARAANRELMLHANQTATRASR